MVLTHQLFKKDEVMKEGNLKFRIVRLQTVVATPVRVDVNRAEKTAYLKRSLIILICLFPAFCPSIKLVASIVAPLIRKLYGIYKFAYSLKLLFFWYVQRFYYINRFHAVYFPACFPRGMTRYIPQPTFKTTRTR